MTYATLALVIGPVLLIIWACLPASRMRSKVILLGLLLITLGAFSAYAINLSGPAAIGPLSVLVGPPAAIAIGRLSAGAYKTVKDRRHPRL